MATKTKRHRRRAPPTGKVLRPIHPNAGITAAYRQRLDALIRAMHESVLFWLSDVYRVDPGLAQDAGGRPPRLMPITPAQLGRLVELIQGTNTTMRGPKKPREFLIREGLVRQRSYPPGYQGVIEFEATPEGEKIVAERLAAEGRTIESLRNMVQPFLAISAEGDPLPSEILTRAMADLTALWTRQFDTAAPRLADYFATAVGDRTSGALTSILREGGFSVRLQMTRPMLDALNATTAENVALIKSIPQQYLTQVEGMVMRSVTAGRDLGTLAKDIENQYGVTKRRAALIARDQNNKATAVISRARFKQIGVKQAIWQHSAGGREPRPTHVANSGKPFDVDKGWFDPAVNKYIQPGELINCFPASTQIQFADLVEKAFRHRYCGQLAEIVTHSGKTLTATPNHPILTPHGWAAINTLKEGDHVIDLSQEGIPPVHPEGNAYDREPMISQIFDTIAKLGERWLEVALRDDFHGDAIIDDDINIILAAHHLFFGLHRLHPQRLRQLGLSVADLSRLGLRSLDQFLATSFSPSDCIVGGMHKAFSAIHPLIAHPDKAGLATVAGDASDLDDISGHGTAIVPADRGEFQNTDPALMLRAQMTRIVGVRQITFEGHVYNLQTAHGWYVAEGIIVHNCRCVARPFLPGFT